MREQRGQRRDERTESREEMREQREQNKEGQASTVVGSQTTNQTKTKNPKVAQLLPFPLCFVVSVPVALYFREGIG